MKVTTSYLLLRVILFQVEKCRANDHELQRFAQLAAAAKSTVQHFTHKRMRSVSVLQSRIREQVLAVQNLATVNV